MNKQIHQTSIWILCLLKSWLSPHISLLKLAMLLINPCSLVVSECNYVVLLQAFFLLPILLLQTNPMVSDIPDSDPKHVNNYVLLSHQPLALQWLHHWSDSCHWMGRACVDHVSVKPLLWSITHYNKDCGKCNPNHIDRGMPFGINCVCCEH
jgi:hypothetical protein